MPKKAQPRIEQDWLYTKPEVADDGLEAEVAVKQSDRPVWTDNKAHFIMSYLRYFVLLTKHGTYIDGFAGPQEECETDAWSAKRVLASEPQWIKHFHLCDQSKAQIGRLEELKAAQPLTDKKGRKLYRKINIYKGDFNTAIDDILANGKISHKQATFCLLDQRTFECQWQTVEKLARHKQSHNKIELFYFLANGWLDRALSNQKDLDVLERWWGRDDWTELKKMSRDERANVIMHRLKKDLGYKSVKCWPVYERKDGGKTMYYMIHATDHPEAPKFMSRAYRRAISPLEPIEQFKLELYGEGKGPTSQVILEAPRSLASFRIQPSDRIVRSRTRND
jgi:three-Cys-motif partner protein